MDGQGDAVAFHCGEDGADAVVGPVVQPVGAGVGGEVQVMEVVLGGEGQGILKRGGAGVVADAPD